MKRLSYRSLKEKRNHQRLVLMILHMLCLIFLWQGQGQAAQRCSASITATTPTSDFIDYGNGTVMHTKTGLVWKKCIEGMRFNGQTCVGIPLQQILWSGALSHAALVNANGGFAGFTDWRVPNIKELSTIVERKCVSPTINLVVFPNTTTNGRYWSSTPSSYNAGKILAVEFTYGGNLEDSSQVFFPNYVRLVRGGQ